MQYRLFISFFLRVSLGIAAELFGQGLLLA